MWHSAKALSGPSLAAARPAPSWSAPRWSAPLGSALRDSPGWRRWSRWLTQPFRHVEERGFVHPAVMREAAAVIAKSERTLRAAMPGAAQE